MECYGCIFHRQTRAIVLHYPCMMGSDTSPVSCDNGFIQDHGGGGIFYFYIEETDADNRLCCIIRLCQMSKQTLCGRTKCLLG